MTSVGGVSGSLQGVAVAAGEEKRDLVITIGEGAVVRGRVADQSSGAPVPGARVLLDTPGKSPNATTDATGAFAIKGVPAGQRLRVDLRVPTGPYLPDVLFVRVPAGDKELDVGTIKLIQGKAGASRGRPARASCGRTSGCRSRASMGRARPRRRG